MYVKFIFLLICFNKELKSTKATPNVQKKTNVVNTAGKAQLGWLNVETFTNTKLFKQPFETFVVKSSFECLKHCFAHVEQCRSVNFIKKETIWCHLLEYNAYADIDILGNDNHTTHYSILSKCSNQPCKDNERCIPHYQTNTFTCERATAIVKWCVYFNIDYGTLPIGEMPLKTNANFPHSPSYCSMLTKMLTTSTKMPEKMGSRMSAIFIAPQTGNFKFKSMCNQFCEVFFSAASDIQNHQLIIRQEDWVPYGNYNRRADQTARPVYLEKHGKYFLEILQQDEGVGEFAGLGVVLPDGQEIYPITNEYLSL